MGCHGVEGFEDYVRDKWKKHLPDVGNTEHDAAQDGELAGAYSPTVS